MNGCLIVMPSLFYGGSEKQVRNIIDAISAEKLPLSVLVESSSKDMAEEEKKYVREHDGVSFVLLKSDAIDAKFSNPFRRYWTKIKSVVVLAKAMKIEVKQNNIKIVMVTNLTGLVLLPWAKMLGCQMIYNERNPGIKICNSVWKRTLLKKCEKLVCNSQFASKHMQNALRRDVEVINNGIKEMDLKSHFEKANDTYTIIVPARISEVKNQKIIVKAVKELRKKIPVKVIFAGIAEDNDYYNFLVSYVKEHNLEEYIAFIGYTQEIHKYYESCDMLLLASFEEGTPNVLLEACMYRLKILASNIPMNASCLEDKRFLFDPNSETELINKIMWIKSLSKDELNQVVEKNHEFVIQNYSMDKMNMKYINLLYGETK